MRSLLFCLTWTCLAPIAMAQPPAPVVDSQHLPAPSVSKTNSNFWGSADVLYWAPHMRGLDFAATEDGAAATLGAGNTHEVDFDRDTGFRAQVGYVTNACWGVDVGYTHFGTEGSAVVLRPTGVGQLFATYSHPGGPEEAEIASATASFDLDIFDVVARYPVLDRKFIGIDLFGGFRWANIDHEITSTYDGRDFINGVVADEVDVNAFGFRVGGNTHWRMANGWSVFGRAAVAALYGKIENHRLETNLDGFQTVVDFENSYEQPVFNLDTALGLAWSCRCIQLSSGYEFNVWTNTGDRLRFVDDIEEGGFAAVSGDILLEGFFFRLTADW